MRVRSLAWGLAIAVCTITCGNNPGDDTTDAGDATTQDVTAADAPKETGTSDASKDTGGDGGVVDAPDDASDDGSNDGSSADAIDDAPLDAPTDAPQDAAADADDSGVIDAGSIDAGKGCLGVFCIIGDTCCNNTNSVNYGKCEPTSCKTCCK